MNNLLPDDNGTRTGRPRGLLDRFCRSSSKVIAFLTMLLTGTLGLILGAFFSAPLLASIAAVILGVVILAVLITVTLIYRSCAGCDCHDRCDE